MTDTASYTDSPLRTGRNIWKATVWIASVFCFVACGPMPEMHIEPNGDTVTSEVGAHVDVSVSLAEPPHGIVTVHAISSNEAEGRVSGSARFDPNNWREPQTIVVSGVDDADQDGDVSYDVSFVAGRSQLRSQVIGVLHFVNRDNDLAKFEALGDLPGGDTVSYASAVSDSGDVVVGWSRGPNGDEAVRWTHGVAIQGLGGSASQAHGVSPDGTLIVGTIAEATYEQGRAAVVWRGTAPPELLPGPRTTDGSTLFWVVDGAAVRNDGYVFGTCIQYNAYGTLLKCVYVPSDRDQLQVDGAGQIFAADDASNYAGTSYPDPHAGGLWGSVAVYNGKQLGYPAGSACIRPHACRSEARDFSAAGAVIVGTSLVPAADQTAPATDATLFDTAFIYTEAAGMLRLEDIDAGDEASAAYTIDATGRVIGGFGTDADGRQALLWVDRTPRLLTDVVLEAGGNVPEGWMLREVRAMSPDGRTLVGNGTNPAGNPEAFRVILTRAL